MQTTQEALETGFENHHGFWSYSYFDKDGNEYELTFEPCLFDQQMYVAFYRNKDLLVNKVVVKPGYTKE